MTRERKPTTVKQSPPPVDRLSWGDTIFLNLEREGMPMNVASVFIFEGELAFKEFFRFIDSKLPLVPRYFKRVVQPPFGLGLPTWEFDPDFDLRRHVREVTLKHGSETELKALASKLFSKLMDRQHPLWDMTLVPRLKGGRTAVVIRLHHCLTDGVAGVGMMNAFFNPDAQAATAPPLNITEVPRPSDALASLTTGLVETYSDFMQRILSGLNDALTIVQRATATATANGGAAAKGGSIPPEEFSLLLPEITALTERMRFNVVCHGPQKFAWTEVSLPEVKAIKSKFGTSVNDVILAVVTATFRRYLEAHGDNVDGRLLRMMVPVNTRSNGGDDELGNNISLIPVTVPLEIRDARKLLEAVHRRSEFLKRAHAAELVGLTGGLVGLFPNGLQAIAGPILSQLPITPFNLVCTNVPGPQFPLYLLGHKMLRWYPYVPIGGEMAVNCAILSYDGMMYFGFSGNVHAAPDLRRLEVFVKESFAELREAAGIKTLRKHVVPRKKAHANKNARTKKRAKPAPAPRKPVSGSLSQTHNVSVPPPEKEPSRGPGTEKEPEPALLNMQ
ncbi:MAG: wax ester/triacylglycerol synthase family O-acyltransferase [Candidatus Korobacteraceae bacterium]